MLVRIGQGDISIFYLKVELVLEITYKSSPPDSNIYCLGYIKWLIMKLNLQRWGYPGYTGLNLYSGVG